MTYLPQAVTTAAEVHHARHLAGIGLIAVGVLLWIGWIIVISVQKAAVWNDEARFGYFIADCIIVAPGALVSGIGFLSDERWAAPVMLVTIGAALYDLTHFAIFLYQIGVPKLGGRALAWAWYAGAIVLVWAVLSWFGVETVRVAESTGVTTPPAEFAVVVGVLLALMVAILSWRAHRRPPPPGGRP